MKDFLDKISQELYKMSDKTGNIKTASLDSIIEKITDIENEIYNLAVKIDAETMK